VGIQGQILGGLFWYAGIVLESHLLQIAWMSNFVKNLLYRLTLSSASERLAGYKKKNPTISSLPNHEHFQELFPHKARKLIRDADNQEICFVDRGRQYLASADYYLDPFKANNDRGDWGKCLPEELFGIMW
jgi:hypothetical protein